MKFGLVSLSQAEGLILAHNIMGADGSKALRKGTRLRAEHLEILHSLGEDPVYVAEVEPGDVGEDAAAGRLAQAAAGAGIYLSKPAAGRCNLIVAEVGLLTVNLAALCQVNQFDGITLATLNRYTVVPARRMVATAKIIPYAVPEGDLAQAEAFARSADGLVSVRPLVRKQAGIIFSGAESARAHTLQTFEPSIRGRIEELGGEVVGVDYVPLTEQAIAEAIDGLAQAGANLLVLAGDTAIMDRQDVIPRAIERAGGEVAHFGVPVDPGNLMLVAYREGLPLLGAPGCVRSRHANVVDQVLPRLMAGERLTKADFIEMAHGGLLEG